MYIYQCGRDCGSMHEGVWLCNGVCERLDTYVCVSVWVCDGCDSERVHGCGRAEIGLSFASGVESE